MEGVAAKYLATAHGWQLLEKNARFREGEIDLIMEAEGELRFVEVKARRNEKFGGVVEALTTQKIQRLKKAIYRWRGASDDKRTGQIVFLGILMEGERVTFEEFCVE